MRHSRRKIDLTGQRFGLLTVLCPAENVGRRTAWLCRCDCGLERVFQTKSLRNRDKTHCGCRGNGRRTQRNPLGLTYIDGTCVEMLAAKTTRKNNTSGVPGVDWCSSKRRWRTTICFKGKRHYLGSYVDFEDAVQARRQGEEALHNTFLREFAENVGEAAQG